MRILDVHPGHGPETFRLIDIVQGTVPEYDDTPYLTGITTDYGGSGGYRSEERVCIGARGQQCTSCRSDLVCEEDWIGGGSHYWTLLCMNCGRYFDYDTYDFKLHEDGEQLRAHYG